MPRTLDPITMDEATQREAGRLLIRMARAWLKLTPEDVERGARAVATDPGYGAEIVQAATIHARALRDFAILEAVRAAADTVRNGWARQQSDEPSSAMPDSQIPTDLGPDGGTTERKEK